MPRRAPTRATLLALLAAILLAGCVDSQVLQQALRDIASQARQDLSHDRDGDGESGGEAESPAALDSLLRLAAQDVGVDPDEGSVQRAIWRVKVIKLNLATARQSLDNTRQEIFHMAATAEELKALREMDDRRAAVPDSLGEEWELERRRLQDEAIERARADGRLQRKRLTGEQAGRVGLLLYNLGVGVVCDNLALRHIKHMDDDFKQIRRELGEGGLDAVVAWGSLAAYRKDFFAIPQDLTHILGEAPAQVTALTAMIGTVRVLKENNPIEEREVREGDTFVPVEDF